MKVYGTLLIAKTSWPTTARQARVIVAARSKTEAARILGMSLYEFNQYGSVSWNAEENETAMSKPGTPFVQKAESGPDRLVYAEVVL